jgi:squalene-hopene/tetraprenyl-beta-curcumene cyclase
MDRTLETQDIARRSLTRAVDYLRTHQHEDGAWRLAPEPRILENGLIALVSRDVKALAEAAGKAKQWLTMAKPQTHHPIPAVIDTWLLRSLFSDSRGVDLGDPTFEAPEFRHRKLFFNVLAIFAGATVEGGIPRAQLLEKLQGQLLSRRELRLKSWAAAEIGALALLLSRPGETNTPQLVKEGLAAIQEAQTPTGSIAGNSVSTAIAVAALNRWDCDGETLRRAVSYLVQNQEADGTWRFTFTDVWDTALLLRVLQNREVMPEDVRQRAVSFLVRSQNSDGGWPYLLGVESDTDTTGVTMLGIGSREPGAFLKGTRYLLQVQREDGIWQTWHYKDDPPAEDVVAHATLALNSLDPKGTITSRARTWLASRISRDDLWRAHWYNSRSYAAHEIGMALGRTHTATRYAARRILESQNSDGGWASASSNKSTPAATGMAIALLSQYLAAEDPVLQRGVRYLSSAQDADGSWSGPTELHAPRPFSVDYQLQTHAMATIGMVAAAHRQVGTPTSERRRSSRSSDYLLVELR